MVFAVNQHASRAELRRFGLAILGGLAVIGGLLWYWAARRVIRRACRAGESESMEALDGWAGRSHRLLRF